MRSLRKVKEIGPPHQVVIGARPVLVSGLVRAAKEANLLIRQCASGGAELLQSLARATASVLLLDVHLGYRFGGIDLMQGGVLGHDVTTILVSDEVDREVLARTRHVGAAGFVVWPTTTTQLEATLSAAVGGRGLRPRAEEQGLRQATSVLQRIAEELATIHHLVPAVPAGPKLRPLPELRSLSPREWEVLRGLVEHRRVPTLARDLHISPHTVRNHLKSIYSKLSVHSQTELLEKIIDRSSSSTHGSVTDNGH